MCLVEPPKEEISDDESVVSWWPQTSARLGLELPGLLGFAVRLTQLLEECIDAEMALERAERAERAEWAQAAPAGWSREARW